MALPEIIPIAEALSRIATQPYQELIALCQATGELRCFPDHAPNGWVELGVIGGDRERLNIVWGSSRSLGASFPMSEPSTEEQRGLPRASRWANPDIDWPGAQQDRTAQDAGALLERPEHAASGSLRAVWLSEDRFLFSPPCYGSWQRPIRGVLIARLNLNGRDFTEIHSGLLPDLPLLSLLADDNLTFVSQADQELGRPWARELWIAARALKESQTLAQCLGPEKETLAQRRPRPRA